MATDNRADSKPYLCEASELKDRATIVCRRGDHVLLVARERSRWALPGGTVRRTETPVAAARRELEEETTLSGLSLAYLFAFGGLNKRHHVYLVDLPHTLEPEPHNEITRCRWFGRAQLDTLLTSVPTREIVHMVWSRQPLADMAETFDMPSQAASLG
jgi:8-oxo-dGTP diphosphatase